MNTRRATAFLAMSLLSALTGCTSLPEINAKSVSYESSHPAGGSSIQLMDLEVTETEVKARKYRRVTKLWGFTQTVEIEGYRRERSPDRKPETLAP